MTDDNTSIVTMSEDPKLLGSLVATISAVMADIGKIVAQGFNEHFRYNFLGDAELMGNVQPAMAKHGLSILPIKADILNETDPIGKLGRRIDIRMRWLIANDKGGFVILENVASGVDPADKGLYKAMTGARKYLHRLVFQVSTDTDPDTDDGGGGGGEDGNRGSKSQDPSMTRKQPDCPDCGGPTWDNRKRRREQIEAGKKAGTPSKDIKAWPAFACKDKEGCKWVAWSAGEYFEHVDGQSG